MKNESLAVEESISCLVYEFIKNPKQFAKEQLLHYKFHDFLCGKTSSRYDMLEHCQMVGQISIHDNSKIKVSAKTREKALEEFIQSIKTKYGAKIDRIILFGSYARGDYRKESIVNRATKTIYHE